MKKYRYKRALDTITISCFCIFGFPVIILCLVIISLAIKIDNPGPVFYRQTRLSRNGREFRIIKFRTMIVDAEKISGPVLVSILDPRITTVGKILRKTRFDELPQIINILRGEMSIVGPRPERPELIYKIKESVPNYDHRLKILPGLTGFAQLYNPNNSNFSQKLKYDRVYMQNMCLWLDIKIITLSMVKVWITKEL